MKQVEDFKRMAEDGVPDYVISLIKRYGYKDISLLTKELEKREFGSYESASKYLAAILPEYFYTLDQKAETEKYIRLIRELGTNLERLEDKYTYTDLLRKVINLRPGQLHRHKITEEDVDNLEKELICLVLDWFVIAKRVIKPAPITGVRIE